MKFNRYWICDSSGIGVENWIYFAGDFSSDMEEARSYIKEYLETWTEYSSYSMDVELDVVPPAEVVESEIQKCNNHIEFYSKRIAELTAIRANLE